MDLLIVFLKPLLEGQGRGTVVSGINVFNQGSPVEDYRIPDLTFVAAGREWLLAPDGIRGGGPTPSSRSDQGRTEGRGLPPRKPRGSRPS